MENNKQEIERNEVVTVNYSAPKFWHRLMANFIDFFLMLITFLILFLSTRAIVFATPYLQKVENRISEIQLASGLFKKDLNEQNGNVDIVYYLNTYIAIYGDEFDGESEEGGEPVGKIGLIVASINQFIAFCSNLNNVSSERYQELLNYYDEIRLDTLTSQGIHYFVRDGEDIKPNQTLLLDGTTRQYFYKDVYTPLIEKRFLPFLTTNVTEYRELFRVEFEFLLFLEIPVSYALAGILVYFIPPLFMKRGRKTIGKAIYHIGLIDDRVLSPSFGRFVARFAIFYFTELILSLFTLGLPYIISFTIMAFSKNKQGFQDYMLHLYEVDVSKANIYMDYVEATLKNKLHGEAIDFKMDTSI